MHSSKKPIDIVVAGNATLDAIIEGKIIQKLDDMLKVNSQGVVKTFEVEDPPLRRGHKHRVNKNLEQEVRPLLHRYVAGGGGINSALAMRRLMEDSKHLGIYYLDVSESEPLIVQTLRENKIRDHFFNHREVPINAVLGDREDKIVLKGPLLGRVRPGEEDKEEAFEVISKSNGLLINSVKDPGYVEHYLSSALASKIAVYAVITSSLEKDFALNKLIPNSRPIFNYDDISDLFGSSPLESHEDKKKFSLEALKEIRSSGTSSNHPLVVTLGKHGVLCAKKGTILYVSLNPLYAEKVEKAVKKANGHTNGAGDTFAGAYALHDVQSGHKGDLGSLMIRASIASIRHIGYKGKLPESAFDVIRYPLA